MVKISWQSRKDKITFKVIDVRVTNVNSRSNHGKYRKTMFKEQENENRKYNQRVMDVEMGTFKPLVFGTNGGHGTRLSGLFKNSRK